MLGYEGIDVIPSRTIEETVREAEKRKFDAYLLDSRFPDGSGLLLCRRLLERTPHISVVFYSGDGRVNEKKMGLAAGASEYLVKPGSKRSPRLSISWYQIRKACEPRVFVAVGHLTDVSRGVIRPIKQHT